MDVTFERRTTTDEDCIRPLVRAGPSIHLDEIRQELDFACGEVSVLLAANSHTHLHTFEKSRCHAMLRGATKELWTL